MHEYWQEVYNFVNQHVDFSKPVLSCPKYAQEVFRSFNNDIAPNGFIDGYDYKYHYKNAKVKEIFTLVEAGSIPQRDKYSVNLSHPFIQYWMQELIWKEAEKENREFEYKILYSKYVSQLPVMFKANNNTYVKQANGDIYSENYPHQVSGNFLHDGFYTVLVALDNGNLPVPQSLITIHPDNSVHFEICNYHCVARLSENKKYYRLQEIKTTKHDDWISHISAPENFVNLLNKTLE